LQHTTLAKHGEDFVEIDAWSVLARRDVDHLGATFSQPR
jgi:hypothetical protein